MISHGLLICSFFMKKKYSRTEDEILALNGSYEYDEVNDAITVGSGASFPYNSTNLHHELIDFMNRSSTYKLTYSGDELYYEFYN